jgi:hypothetical protein
MTAQTVDVRIPAELRSEMRRWRNRAAVVGAAGAVLTAIGMVAVSPNQFYRSYLWSYIFVLGLSLGPMAWLMLQYVTGGAWGAIIRRPAEAAARTLPLVAAMFLPIVLGMNNLYPWMPVHHLALPAHQAQWLRPGFFLARAAVYFAGWLLLAWLFSRWSAQEDREGAAAARRKLGRLAGPGLVFWGMAVSFMSIDWILSVKPEWFSTMFPLLVIVGQALTAMAFLIALLVLLSFRRPMSEVLTPRHLHDLGKFLLALVMVWAYFSFSQFLIIWAGNLPEEIPWYQVRLNHGWEAVALLLVIGHFALPFALLLSRDLKRNFKLLAWIAGFILAMRLVDLYWQISPYFRAGVFGVSWLDFTAPVGLVGIWLAYFLAQLEKRPLLAPNEPELEEVLAHGRE